MTEHGRVDTRIAIIGSGFGGLGMAIRLKKRGIKECAAAFVAGIDGRKRTVFVPRSLAPLAAIRQLFMSPLSDWVMRRPAARMIPAIEQELATLDRAFGANSMGMGARAPRSK